MAYFTRRGEAADPPQAIQPDLTVKRELLTQALPGSQQTRLDGGKGQTVSGGIIRLLHALQITVPENIPVRLGKLLSTLGKQPAKESTASSSPCCMANSSDSGSNGRCLRLLSITRCLATSNSQAWHSRWRRTCPAGGLPAKRSLATGHRHPSDCQIA